MMAFCKRKDSMYSSMTHLDLYPHPYSSDLPVFIHQSMHPYPYPYICIDISSGRYFWRAPSILRRSQEAFIASG